MNEKVRDFVRNNVGYIIIVFVSVVYILTAFVSISKTGKTISQIIGDGAIALILGVMFNRIFELQGLMSGERDEKVKATTKLHGETVLKITPYINLLDTWCEMKNKENLKEQRTKILANAGMRYDAFFDENGVAKEFTPDESKLANKYTRANEKLRIKCYKKAVRLKLTPLVGMVLTSEGGKTQDKYNLGKTKSQYETKSGIKDAISKLGIACIFGYYGIELIQDFSYAQLIWTALKVGVFLIMGSIKLYQAYMFVTEEWRGRIIKKIDNLEQFNNWASKQEATNEQQSEISR